MESNICKPELLAPAGNLETAVAAFSAGADAVYLGLGKFNARNRAENFQVDDLARLLDFAHRQGRKVYVTLNTLIAESELADLASCISSIAALPVDAVIVQDLGVLYMLRRYFPHLTVHASTQMGIHNSAGIRALEKLGVKRVILERQITFEELKSIASSTDMELEVFVHGSLCLSLSGRCLLSHYAEDASGNRGMCRQLCRRNYRRMGDNTGKPFLSPMDLEMIARLPELAKLKISSLKIEGRLRGPDYVVPVVSAYRKALDALPEVSSEALNMIRRTVSRPAGEGAWLGFDRMISNYPQAVFGRCVGRIKSVSREGIIVQLSDRIHLGDKLRIVGSANTSLAGFELMQLQRNGQKVNSASGCTVLIPGRYHRLDGENFLFKIGENGYDFKRQAAALPAAKKTVKLALKLDKNGLTVTTADVEGFVFRSEPFAAARQCSIKADDLREIFTASAGALRGSVESIEICGEWFGAKSVLKDLRRELFGQLEEILNRTGETAADPAVRLMQFYREYQQTVPAADKSVIPAADLTLPGFIAEGDLKLWQEKIRHCYNHGKRHFAVGGLHGIVLLHETLGSLRDVAITGVYPLMVCNSLATKLLKGFSVTAVECSIELPLLEQQNLREHSILPVLEPRKDCELLVTRIPLKVRKIIDKDDQTYRIEFDPTEKLFKLSGTHPAGEKFSSDGSF